MALLENLQICVHLGTNLCPRKDITYFFQLRSRTKAGLNRLLQPYGYCSGKTILFLAKTFLFYPTSPQKLKQKH